MHHTMTALYPDEAAACRAMERLSDLGLPDDMMKTRDAEVDGAPRHPRGGLFAAFASFAVADADLATFARGLGRSGCILVATVPEDLHAEVHHLLDADALDLDDRPAPGSPRA